jgi:hypothetical protein
MMDLVTASLLIFALQAPGEIYRCPASDGSVHYQDQPCAGGKQFAGGADEQELRSWLEGMAAPAARPTARSSGGSARASSGSAPILSASERLIAVCSERFLACASDKPALMDRCVAALPRCSSSRSSGCCPSSCVEAYQVRRSQGSPLPNAVRGALLDPASGPSCAAPGR